MKKQTAPENSTQLRARAIMIVKCAGQIGGYDEIIAIADRGWSSLLLFDTPELRRAIQEYAKTYASEQEVQENL